VRFAFKSACLILFVTATSILRTVAQTPVLVHTEESKYRNSIYAKSRQQLIQGDFDSLEKSAQEFRESKASYFHGSWALTSFYIGVADIDYETPDGECLAFLQNIRAWVAAKPNSVTARVALASALRDYAWKARGTGWSDSVTESGAALMSERLAEAWKVLEEAKKLPTKCPVWWETAQMVALAQGWDKKRYFALFNEATALEPSYIDFYSHAVLYLQPRWYGEEGESEKFIEEQANRRIGVEGDLFYARMIWLLDRRRLDENLFKAHPQLSWQRTVRGFDELIRRYPDSLSLKSEFARLCFATGDKERARPLFQQIGSSMDVRIWCDRIDTFLLSRKWALEQ
jgi:hypothetical protein